MLTFSNLNLFVPLIKLAKPRSAETGHAHIETTLFLRTRTQHTIRGRRKVKGARLCVGEIAVRVYVCVLVKGRHFSWTLPRSVRRKVS